MSTRKKQIRNEFNRICLERDGYKCRVCGVKDSKLEVHHIQDRSEMPNGGYVMENGITLCPDCHIKAETFHISKGEVWELNMHPNDLYKMINSDKARAFKASEKLNRVA